MIFSHQQLFINVDKTEFKNLPIEIKDFDENEKTAVIAHAVFNVIDRDNDIVMPGSFKKCYEENKNKIDFYFNHEKDKPIGKVVDVWEDDHKAYTKVKFGDWTLAKDVQAMAEAGVLKGASFGYNTLQRDYVKTKEGRIARRLKELRHKETSLLTKEPSNPEAGIVSLKSLQEEIEETKSSDKVDSLQIEWLQQKLDEAKRIAEQKSVVNTDSTPPEVATSQEPLSSDTENFADALQLLTLRI